MPTLKDAKKRQPEVLDAASLAALEKGLEMAASDPRRWTPEQVRIDARRVRVREELVEETESLGL